MLECLRLGGLGGDFTRVSTDAAAPDQSPKETLSGPILEEGRDGGEGKLGRHPQREGASFACGVAGNASKDDSSPIPP